MGFRSKDLFQRTSDLKPVADELERSEEEDSGAEELEERGTPEGQIEEYDEAQASLEELPEGAREGLFRIREEIGEIITVEDVIESFRRKGPRLTQTKVPDTENLNVPESDSVEDMAPTAQEEESSSAAEADAIEDVERYLAEFRSRQTERVRRSSEEGPKPIDDLFEKFFEAERPPVEDAESLSNKDDAPAESAEDLLSDFGWEIIADSSLSEGGEEASAKQIDEEADSKGLNAEVLYKNTLAYVADSIQLVRNRQIPEVELAEQLVEQIAASLSEDTALLRYSTDRDQDYSISAHSANVTIIGLYVGQFLKVSDEQLRKIGIAGLLHEVGVVRLPEGLTQRDDQISTEEKEQLLHRPVFANEVLKQLGKGYAWLPETVGQIYEREDGSGFPLALRGDEISEEAKILGLADYFDACIQKRPYRRRISGYRALYELTNEQVGEFSDRIVKGLIKTLSLYPYNEYVELDSGEIAVVVEVNRENLSRPRVRLLYGQEGQKLNGESLIDLSEHPSRYIAKALTVGELPT